MCLNKHLIYTCRRHYTYDILQRTATHCNALQRTATHCNTLQRTATHIDNTTRMIYTCATYGHILCLSLYVQHVHVATHCNTLQHTAAQCNTLQHIATHCNTLQHTATHLVVVSLCSKYTCVYVSKRVSKMLRHVCLDT